MQRLDDPHLLSAEPFDAVVLGGGPSGATAAHDLACRGYRVALADREGRIKPCGGAIPPKLLQEFNIPQDVLVNRVRGARIISPKQQVVGMPIDDGYVGMVDRADFDPWLRARAERAGAVRLCGSFSHLERAPSQQGDLLSFFYREKNSNRLSFIKARYLIAADGAKSRLAQQEIERADEGQYVFAYHEILEAPQILAKPEQQRLADRGRCPSPASASGFAFYDPNRCDVFYDGSLSPDFYAWVFPHGSSLSIGTGSALKGFSQREAIEQLRHRTGLSQQKLIRREGAPIPLKPLPRWDNGRDIVLAGDAAGVVAPASGEGIYYAMLGGRMAAQAVTQCLAQGSPKALGEARKRFMRLHGQVFWVLGLMQRYWYANDQRRERFVRICQDHDVQQLTWDAYMNKELVKAKPLAHARIFFKNLAHLSGLASV
ncbi:MAG: geranylgeranyl diphosphate reductase [Betaproteobacteria bacterium]|jgi:geranylgeranyl reductase|nr:FAD-dependent monooxygenase [Pseudomonadota bacterium]NBO94822.1 geranylgeranyl diphosphate reductase [Betaproteobacteria bacterium]HAB48065.1 geranylgeranyl diphosphate reductase [Lautropia sp.]NBP35778.1 geranylgeranyl diphosphate reductase [Betaproteobacteria bacterium]NBP37697.1 geranylgeranyl diphosphate reductase [Betaproteobacteria bacterium]